MIDRMAEARGFLQQIDFKFVFNLCMFYDLLLEFKSVSDYMQSVDAEIGKVLNLVESSLQNMESYRSSHEFFNKIYNECVQICTENRIDIPSDGSTTISNKRKSKIPKKYENFVVSGNHLESEDPVQKDEFRTKLLIPALDVIIQELNDRFTGNDPILRALGSFSPSSDNFLSYSLIEPAAVHYNIDLELLQAQLKLIPKTMELYEKEKKIKIESTMTFLDFLEVYKHAFWDVYNLCIISVTIPISSAGCERTFSCLRYIKSYLRNTMLNDRLTNLSILYIEKKIARSLDLDAVVERFANGHKNIRMVQY